jgi:hypothetical protein
MRRFPWPLVVVTGLISSGISVIPAAQVLVGAKPVDDVDSYAVYAALVRQEWPVTAAKATSLVVREETSTFETCVPSGPPMEAEWREVLDAYKRENAEPRTVVAGRNLGLPCVIVTLADFKRILTSNQTDRMGGWTFFYRRYPDSGGYISMSAVGFDQSHRRALVSMDHSCGILCGGGTYHLLEKAADGWREVHPEGLKSCAWAS